MTPAYRLADSTDLRRLAESRWRFREEESGSPSPEGKAAFLDRCERFLAEALSCGRWALWLAETNGEIVAHAFLQVVDKVPSPDRPADALGYLTNVYTVPAERGRGIGTILLDHVRAWAIERNLELMIVWPSDRSRGLYRRAGFAEPAEVLELILRPD